MIRQGDYCEYEVVFFDHSRVGSLLLITLLVNVLFGFLLIGRFKWIGVGFSAFMLVVTPGILIALHFQYWFASRNILLCINSSEIHVFKNEVLVGSVPLKEIEKVEKWGPFSPQSRVKEYFYYKVYSVDSVLYVSSLLCENFEEYISLRKKIQGGNSPFLPTLKIVCVRE